MPLATTWNGTGSGATVRELLAFLDELYARRFRNGRTRRSSFEFLDQHTSLHISASAAESTDPASDEERILIALLQAFQYLARSQRGGRLARTVKHAAPTADHVHRSAAVPALVRRDIACATAIGPRAHPSSTANPEGM